MSDRRIGLLSQRGMRPEVARCTGFEFEDVVETVEDAELLVPRPRRGTHFLERNASRTLSIAGRAPVPSRLYQPIERVADDYDVLVAVFEFPQDVVSLAALPRRRQLARTSVCILEEVWTVEVEGRLGHHIDRIAGSFDELFTTAYASIPALEARTGRTWHFLPFAVDMTLFGPVDPPRSRSIDVINIGRRSEITHQALVEWARARGAFYYFDSFKIGPVKRCRDHRLLLSNLMRSSRIAITNRGVGADPTNTRHQESLAFRMFEATAGGAAMIGAKPDLAVFDELFDWPGAFVDVPFDCPDIGDRIDELRACPDELEAASLAGVATALRRHDHAHRWAQVLKVLGLEPTGALTERLDALAARASGLVSPGL